MKKYIPIYYLEHNKISADCLNYRGRTSITRAKINMRENLMSEFQHYAHECRLIYIKDNIDDAEFGYGPELGIPKVYNTLTVYNSDISKWPFRSVKENIVMGAIV